MCHSSRIRFYVFFKVQKRDFLRFFEVSYEKGKKRRKRCPSFHFSFSIVKLLTDTFTVNQLHTCRVIIVLLLLLSLSLFALVSYFVLLVCYSTVRLNCSFLVKI